jgi:hypothetical protein
LKKNNFYIWCCDFYRNTGEGRLANLYLYYLKKTNPNASIEVENFNTKFLYSKKYKYFESKQNNFNFYFKYITPIFGIIKLWINFFSGKKIFYLNYLPLWNSLIFIFSPPGTIFGPITGGLFLGKVKNLSNFLRKFLLPFFFRVSQKFIELRNINIIFATCLLKSIISKRIKKKSIFDFQTFYLLNKKINKNNLKKIIIFYNRKHSNKVYKFDLNEINFLFKKKISVIGDFYNNHNAINYYYISGKKLKNLLENSRYALTSMENYASFFILDCFLNNIYLISKKIFYARSGIIKFKLVKGIQGYKVLKINVNKKNLIFLYKKLVIFLRN